MPVIVFESSKGGAGKSTSALLVALRLVSLGSKVTILDADPNRPIKRWAAHGNAPQGLAVISDADEDNIIERIEDAVSSTQYVIVDLEGTASKIVLLAVSQADFVVIPTQGSELDVAEASKGVKVIKQHEKVSRRVIPYSVLITRTQSAIRTKNVVHMIDGLKKMGIPVFDTELNDREAFRSVFWFGQPLENLNPSEVSNIDKAKDNVNRLIFEMLQKLVDHKKQSETQEVA